jgi:hypothetical protein
VAPDTCIQGYIWREAFPGDRVCVTPLTRLYAAADNKLAASRLERDPSKRHQGQDTCLQEFVWREAGPKDRVCTDRGTREQAAEDNKQAASRAAR